MGSVDRLGWRVGGDFSAALFGFDDVLIMVRLNLSFPRFRATKKNRDALTDLARTPHLSPDQVLSNWNHSMSLPVANVQSAVLRKAGGIFHPFSWIVTSTEGGCMRGEAHRSAKEPLDRLLVPLLGNRYSSRDEFPSPSERRLWSTYGGPEPGVRHIKHKQER